MKSIKERFLRKVRLTSKCWEWIGGKCSGGYGSFVVRGKVCVASRVSFELFKGDIPGGLNVCHSCDNPGCVNPEHLFLGTDFDNNRDREIKNRGNHAKGERHGQAKLTDLEVAEARQLRINGLTYQAVADRYGVTKQCIRFRCIGKYRG